MAETGNGVAVPGGRMGTAAMTDGSPRRRRVSLALMLLLSAAAALLVALGRPGWPAVALWGGG
ncbi:MAG: hypothetical protein HRF46_14120, partial [Acidobacteriota bacterium]